jgi:hypothetical protein
LNSDGSFQYDAPDFGANDKFQYQIFDGIATASAWVNIDVPGSGVPHISITDAGNVQEQPGAVAVFTVQLSAAATSDVWVQYTTQDGVAMSGEECNDYITQAGTLTFLAGQTVKHITVDLVDDPLPELDEDFSVVLQSASSNAAIHDGTGVANILANDGPIDNGLQLLVAGTDQGTSVQVRVFDGNTHDLEYQIVPYNNFNGGSRVATGDFNGDGFPDVVTGAGIGGGPHVRVFNGLDGTPLPFTSGGGDQGFFAYSTNFLGGIYVATGDVNGDGYTDIITGTDADNPDDSDPFTAARVRVFSGAPGSGGAMLVDILPYGSFTGGARVSSADLNADGRDDPITAAGPGGGPHVLAYDAADSTLYSSSSPPISALLRNFFAYNPGFTGGVYIAAGDINGDIVPDIITGPGAGGGPNVVAYSGVDQSILTSFFAYAPTFSAGVRVAVGDISGSGINSIVTGPGPGGASHIRTFALDQTDLLSLCSFYAFDLGILTGFFVAAQSAPPLDLTAHTPQTEPFEERPIPAAREQNPGVGIRRNGDDDNGDMIADVNQSPVADEDDLIKVKVDVGARITGAIYFIKKDNNNIAVWSNQTKDQQSPILAGATSERLVPFSSTVKSFTYWVEWTNTAPGAQQAILTLEARSLATGNVLKSTSIKFVPFTSVVIVLGGHGQDPDDPTDPNFGTFQSAIDLYVDGYDVHMYNENNVASGSGVVYDEVVTAVQKRGVSNLAIFGYSQGGGATYVLDSALTMNKAAIGNFSIVYTAYIDGVRHTGPSPEDRRPIGTGYHVNYWQSLPSGPLNLLGTSIPAANVDIDVRTNAATPWGAGLDHFTVDDHQNVRNAIKNSLKTKTSP